MSEKPISRQQRRQASRKTAKRVAVEVAQMIEQQNADERTKTVGMIRQPITRKNRRRIAFTQEKERLRKSQPA